MTSFTMGGAVSNRVQLPAVGAPVALVVKIRNSAGANFPGISVIFSLADATKDVRLNAGAGAVAVVTDANGEASVPVTRTGENVSPIFVRFTIGTEYPQTYTIPVTP